MDGFNRVHEEKLDAMVEFLDEIPANAIEFRASDGKLLDSYTRRVILAGVVSNLAHEFGDRFIAETDPELLVTFARACLMDGNLAPGIQLGEIIRNYMAIYSNDQLRREAYAIEENLEDLANQCFLDHSATVITAHSDLFTSTNIQRTATVLPFRRK